MLSDNVDALPSRGIGGITPPNATLGPRSCSGDGDGRGRAEPLRGGGDSTVICCGERSDADDDGGKNSNGPSGGMGNENAGETTTFGPASIAGGTVATGVSLSRSRKSASGAMCAMRSPIGVAGIDVGISSGGRTGGMTVVIGGGGVARPDGALRIRRRCLSDVVRAAAVDTGVDVRDGGGGGSGPVGGGLGGTSSAGGMP
jgi:hypothetical protein